MRGHAQVRGVGGTRDTILSSEWELRCRKDSRWFPSPPDRFVPFPKHSEPPGFCSHPASEFGPPAPSLAGKEGDVAALENHPAGAEAVHRQAGVLLGSHRHSKLHPLVPPSCHTAVSKPRTAALAFKVGLSSSGCEQTVPSLCSSPLGARAGLVGRREDTHLWEPWGQALPARKVTEQ